MNREMNVNIQPLDMNLFAREILETHNIYRQLHSVPPLVLDEQLSVQSQECAVLFNQTVDKNRVPTVGENIYIIKTNDPHYSLRGEDIVNEWYHQTCLTSQDLEEDIEDTNNINFTQIVWKNTQLLGVGLSRCENRIVTVCQYVPPGNICGEFMQNVLPVEIEKDRPRYAAGVDLCLI